MEDEQVEFHKDDDIYIYQRRCIKHHLGINKKLQQEIEDLKQKLGNAQKELRKLTGQSVKAGCEKDEEVSNGSLTIE